MADFGFRAEIGRDEDANRWALATADVVAGPGDWAATPVVGQRAVTIAPGQGQAAQITMPGGVGAKTDAVTLQLPFTGSMTHQGKLICREITWTGNGSESDPLAGSSQFVVLDAGDFATWPGLPTPLANVSALDREPGVKYHMPLWFAVVNQSTVETRLHDMRNISQLSGTPERVQWVDVPDQRSGGLPVPGGSWFGGNAVTGSGVDRAQYAIWNGEILWRGQARYRVAGGNLFTGQTILENIPEALRPVTGTPFPLFGGTGAGMVRGFMSASGTLTVTIASGDVTNYLGLEGLRWPLKAA